MVLWQETFYEMQMGIRENACSAMFAFRITLNNTNREKSSKMSLEKKFLIENLQLMLVFRIVFTN